MCHAALCWYGSILSSLSGCQRRRDFATVGLETYVRAMPHRITHHVNRKRVHGNRIASSARILEGDRAATGSMEPQSRPLGSYLAAAISCCLPSCGISCCLPLRGTKVGEGRREARPRRLERHPPVKVAVGVTDGLGRAAEVEVRLSWVADGPAAVVLL